MPNGHLPDIDVLVYAFDGGSAVHRASQLSTGLCFSMVICMKTTLNLNDELIAQAKILAVRRRTTLTSVIEAALREALAEPVREPDIPVWKGSRQILPLDLNDSSAIHEFLDGR